MSIYVSFIGGDFLPALKESGLFEAYMIHELRCSSCNKLINDSDLGLIVLDQDAKGWVSCKHYDCMVKVRRKRYQTNKQTLAKEA